MNNQDQGTVLPQDTLVYFTAYAKNSTTKYICYGHVTKAPPDNTQSYRVLIKAVAPMSPDGIVLQDKRLFVGRAINKYRRELCTDLGPIMRPKKWVE